MRRSKRCLLTFGMNRTIFHASVLPAGVVMTRPKAKRIPAPRQWVSRMERREAQHPSQGCGAPSQGASAARSQGLAKGRLASALAPPGAPFPRCGEKEKGKQAYPAPFQTTGAMALVWFIPPPKGEGGSARSAETGGVDQAIRGEPHPVAFGDHPPRKRGGIRRVTPRSSSPTACAKQYRRLRGSSAARAITQA